MTANRSEENRQERRLLAYGNYVRRLEEIKYFDSVQMTYRAAASTLLLASYAAIGFLMSRPGLSLEAHSLISVIVASILGVLILTSIGLSDLAYQEKLSIASYVEALRLERSHSWLPQVHHMIIHHSPKHRLALKKAVFYHGCVSTLLFTAGAAAILMFKSNLAISLPVGVICTMAAIFFWIYWFTKHTASREALTAESLLELWHMEHHHEGH